MAKFIRCSVAKTNYRQHEITNSPVNIDLVQQVVKSRRKYYPDNEGAPSIKFEGIDKEWVYSAYQKQERDRDYDYIVENKFHELT